MARHIKPDPYCGFRDDQERRRALNARAYSYTAAVVASALTASPINWMEKLQWLKTLFL